MNAPRRLDRSQIEAILPHRAPFLWLDEVTELQFDASRGLGETNPPPTIRTRTYLAPELELFRGHYPQFAVLPGVIQLEICFQAGAILLAHVAPPAPGEVPVVTRVDNVRFRQMLRPGMTAEAAVVLEERAGRAFRMTGVLTAEGKNAARVEFVCTTAPAG